MRVTGFQGLLPGKPVKTTLPGASAPSPLDQVNGQFKAPAPDGLRVSDVTSVATWQGFVSVAAHHRARTSGACHGWLIDAFARRMIGWRVSRTAPATFVLDALEQALHDRRPAHDCGPGHHSDRGVQWVSVRYSERLAEAAGKPCAASVGDNHDNALAETINRLYKAEIIHRPGPWRSFETGEFATLDGATGSIAGACWGLWETSLRLKRRNNIPPRVKRTRPHNSTQTAAAKPGTVQKLMGRSGEEMVLPERFELSTSPLPRECSTPELRQRWTRV